MGRLFEHFSTDDLSPSESRNDRWQTMLSTTHLPWMTRLPTSSTPFEASIQRWWIDDLALVDCDCGPSTGSRQRQQIADTDGEFFVILMNKSGRESVTQNCDSQLHLAAFRSSGWRFQMPMTRVDRAVSTTSSVMVCSSLIFMMRSIWVNSRSTS